MHIQGISGSFSNGSNSGEARLQQPRSSELLLDSSSTRSSPEVTLKGAPQNSPRRELQKLPSGRRVPTGPTSVHAAERRQGPTNALPARGEEVPTRRRHGGARPGAGGAEGRAPPPAPPQPPPRSGPGPPHPRGGARGAT